MLGLLGILPFLFALFWPSLLVFKIYSLAILAFLAGNWWSTALLGRSQTIKQIVPVILLSNVVVLVACVAVLLEHTLALVVLAVLYLVLLIGEGLLPSFEKQPEYYRTMRLVVSTLVGLLHILAVWVF
jgi:hypothetical protein